MFASISDTSIGELKEPSPIASDCFKLTCVQQAVQYYYYNNVLRTVWYRPITQTQALAIKFLKMCTCQMCHLTLDYNCNTNTL